MNRIMGVGPAFAIPAVCEKAGVAIQDIDVFELNEAFASQAVYVIETLGLDENKINLNGGAIALGHRNVSPLFIPPATTFFFFFARISKLMGDGRGFFCLC